MDGIPIAGYRRGSLFTPALMVAGVALVATAVSALAIVWIARSHNLHYMARGAYFIGSTIIGSLSFITLILSIVVASRSYKIPIYNLGGTPSKDGSSPTPPTTLPVDHPAAPPTTPAPIQPPHVEQSLPADAPGLELVNGAQQSLESPVHLDQLETAAEVVDEMDRLFPEGANIAECFEKEIVTPAIQKARALLMVLPLKDVRVRKSIPNRAEEIQKAIMADFANELQNASQVEKTARNQIIRQLKEVVEEITTMVPYALCQIPAEDLSLIPAAPEAAVRGKLPFIAGAPGKINEQLDAFFKEQPLSGYKLTKTLKTLKSCSGIITEFLLVYATERYLAPWYKKFSEWSTDPAGNMLNMQAFFEKLAQ